MAILTYTARIALVEYLFARPIHLAIGKGLEAWDAKPAPPDYEATGLVHELGRKKLTRAFFVNEDDNGEIDMPGGMRYSYSENPTRQLFLHFMFNFGEGIQETIREVGVFINTKTKSGLPENQTYFTPDQITEKGRLIMLEHLETSDTFTPSKKGSYGTILTI